MALIWRRRTQDRIAIALESLVIRVSWNFYAIVNAFENYFSHRLLFIIYVFPFGVTDNTDQTYLHLVSLMLEMMKSTIHMLLQIIGRKYSLF